MVLNNESQVNALLEQRLNQFASLLGTHSLVRGVAGANAYNLKRFLYRDVSNPLGGGVCVLPSFDSESNDPADASMTEPRSENVVKENKEVTSKALQSQSIPPMAASVLGQCSLSRRQSDESEKLPKIDTEVIDIDSSTLQERIGRNLGSKMSWTQSSAHLAPSAMLGSLSNSFANLLETRMKSCTLLLLKHSLKSGDESSRTNLLQLLSTSNDIKVTAVVTTFQTLQLPSHLRAHADDENKENLQDEKVEKKDDSTCEIICPLLFESLMDINIRTDAESFKVRTAGTIRAIFDIDTSLIKYVEVDLDTNSLSKSLTEQAKKVVFKAVAKITQRKQSLSVVTPNNQGILNSASPAASMSSTNLSGPQSLLRRTKRNSFEKTEPDGHNLVKKRSVTWNHPIENKQTFENPNKKAKLFVSGPELKSSKSFGKPDASLFQSNKNATFAEFGRYEGNSTPVFQNGKLSRDRNYTVTNLQNALTRKFSSGHRNATFSQASLSLSSKQRSSTADFMRTLDLFSSRRIG